MRAITFAALAVSSLVLTGCGPRVMLATGTTIGLKATPGDGQTRPPQVTFGYRRTEGTLVPTQGTNADAGKKEDAYSTLAAFYFRTTFFGHTELASFISTGKAANDIQQGAFATHVQLAMAAIATDTALRITERYQSLDAAARERVRQWAVKLKLVPPDTTDLDFADGRLLENAGHPGGDGGERLTVLERLVLSAVAR